MKKRKKAKVLFLLRLPPRLTGATLINSFVYGSQLLRDNYIIKTIRIPHATTFTEVGRLSLFRFLKTIYSLINMAFALLVFRPGFVYFQLSPKGKAFLRDLSYVVIIKVLGRKILYHMHGKGIAEEQKKKLYKILYSYAFKHEAVICLSRNLTRDIAGVYNGKPYIVPNVIKLELNEIPERIRKGHLNILFISNIKIAKGILVFIEALGLLKQRNISFKARMIGNEAGVSKAQLEEYFKVHQLTGSDVQYVGPKYGTEKWEEYKQADVLVFPTLNDIWGLVILEAMQAAIPVIASIDGAIPEIINDGETGFLVEKNNPLQICDKLEYLQHHPEKIKEMGLKGRQKFLATYSLEKFEKDMLQTFQAMCNSI